jgi:hypothetical protein
MIMLKSRLNQQILNLGLIASLTVTTVPVALAQDASNSSLNGQVGQQQTATRSSWSQASPTAKVLTGTAAGAALGGATGLLTGLTMHSTSHHAMKMAKGTAVARGLAWGSVYGAGIGLLAGIGSAIFSPKPVAVSTIGTTASR